MLIWLLRVAGIGMLSASLFMFCPFEWMAAVHRRIGMGELEYTPLLSYLIRTLSALYAILGSILVFASRDVERYHPLIRFLGIVAILGGVGVTILDAILHLPCSGPLPKVR
jgi:cyanate permease